MTEKPWEATTYYTSTITGALYRSTAEGHHVFRDGRWEHTRKIMDYFIGEANDVDPVTEAQAREMEPTAFD